MKDNPQQPTKPPTPPGLTPEELEAEQQ